MTTSTTMVELRNIIKRFGSVIALNGVTMKVHAGEVMCLLGDNGAGKSTLIKCVSGVVEPTAGEIRFAGEPLPQGDPARSLARRSCRPWQLR